MVYAKNWRSALLVPCALLGVFSGAAQAANILVLSTNEPAAADTPGPQRVADEFAQGGQNTVTIQNNIDTAGTVTPATFTASGHYDIVVVLSTYKDVAPNNMAVITEAMRTRAASSFILFMDGCCEPSRNSNITKLLNALNTAIGGGSALRKGANQGGFYHFELNTTSPYAHSFDTSLPSFYGGYVTYLANVPADNILYRASPGQPADSAYGVLYPGSQVNGGAGACLFGVVDITNFAQSYAVNQGKIGPAFISAAMDPGGACAVAGVVKKAFDAETVAPGGSSLLTITLENNTALPATGVRLIDALPAPLQIAGAAATTCNGGTLTAAVGSSTLSLTGAEIPAGVVSVSVSGTTFTAGSCTLTVPVVWPANAACTPPVTNTIQPGRDFTTDQGQVSTVATDTLACNAALPPPGSMTLEKRVSGVADTNGNSVTGDAGDTITYGFSVINTGLTTLRNVRVTDPLLPDLDCTPVTLAPGAPPPAPAVDVVCTGNTYVIQSSDRDITNTATASADDAVPVTATGSAATVSVQPAPTHGLTLDKTASLADTNGNTVAGDPGDVITYTFTVTNTSTVTLSAISLSDAGLPGVSCTPLATLAAGATAELVCSGNTRTIAPADVATGTLSNTARAQGSAPGKPDPVVSNDSTADVALQPTPAPQLELSKLATVSDTNANTVRGDAGDTITYSFSVRNTGNVAFDSITLDDPALASLNCAPLAAPLAPADTALLSCTGTTHTISPIDVAAGKVTNQATAQATWAGGLATVIATDEVQTLLTPVPGLGLSKAASVVDSDNDGVAGDAGDVIVYRFTLSNTGETALEQLTLSDSLLAGLDCDVPASLAVGERVTLTCHNDTATHIITPADVARGYVENTATAAGRWAGTLLDAETVDRVITHLTPVPGLNLVKSWTVVDANANSVAGDAGDRIDFGFTAYNTGSARLQGVTVSDGMLPNLVCTPIAQLPAGSSQRFACTGVSHTITAADVTAGAVRNDATARGTWSDTHAPVAARASVSVVTQPAPRTGLALQITSQPGDGNGNGVTGEPGDTVSFTYTLTNTGTVPLTHLAVSDPRLPELRCTSPVAELAPGATVTLQCTGNVYTLTQDDVAAGSITDTATGHASAPGTLPDLEAEDTVTVPLDSGAVTPIPTLSGWMMALLALLMAGLGMRQRVRV